jgi:hypothetical protein
VFEGVHAAQTIAFVVIDRHQADEVVFGGPFHSHDEFRAGRDQLVRVGTTEFAEWTATAAFPLLRDPMSAEVFRQLRLNPAFADSEDFEFQPFRELDATNDKRWFDTNTASKSGPIPVLTGSSFNLWEPDFGKPYAYASEDALDHLLRKAIGGTTRMGSAFFGMAISDVEDLPFFQCRIAFRDVTKYDNTRTTVACLMPPRVLLVHKAPSLVRRSGDERTEAFLLGVMSSIPFDWYSRRLVELSLSFELLGSFPVPRPSDNDELSKRVTTVSARLAAHDERFADWAQTVGVGVGSAVDVTVREDLLAELDALVARLYGLSRDQLIHIFATFHRGWDYSPRLAKVLGYFEALNGIE